jgi:hypothetical protein
MNKLAYYQGYMEKEAISNMYVLRKAGLRGLLGSRNLTRNYRKLLNLFKYKPTTVSKSSVKSPSPSVVNKSTKVTPKGLNKVKTNKAPDYLTAPPTAASGKVKPEPGYVSDLLEPDYIRLNTLEPDLINLDTLKPDLINLDTLF